MRLVLLMMLGGVAQAKAPDINLLVVDTRDFTLTAWTAAGPDRAVEIGLGQGWGPKEELGDLKTPRGAYYVVDKQKGQLGGRWGAFYGGYWIKINYPGPVDAVRGLDRGWIDDATATRIIDAWQAGKLTPQNTRLGGGVGLHGWASEWDGRGGAHLSFGCVVLHNADMAQLFDRIAIGALVVIL